MAIFREIGATVQYTYRDVLGATVMDFVIAPPDCFTDGKLLAVAAEVNARAPQTLDEYTRLDGAVASYKSISPSYSPSAGSPHARA
jgi:hypothetical protein